MKTVANLRVSRSLPGLSAVIVLLLVLVGCGSVRSAYVAKVKHEFAVQTARDESILKESDIAHLPPPVRRYLAYSGAVGKPRVWNFRLTFDAVMYRKPGGPGLALPSEQYNFYERPARFFFMKGSLFLVPMRVLHAYSEGKATMQVRVAGLFNAVDLSGRELTEGETVTILDDTCFFAPSALAGAAFTWESINDRSARVFFRNGPYRVSAVLHFNERGELINLVSEDRSALQDDGTLRKAPWSTPIRDYREFQGRRIATHGDTIWHYPEGDYTYGTFTLRSIEYNLPGFRESGE